MNNERELMAIEQGVEECDPWINDITQCDYCVHNRPFPLTDCDRCTEYNKFKYRED